jgi:protein-tyrosine kinase
MANIVEQATRRLEELRRAGVVIPWSSGQAAAAPSEPAVAEAPPRVTTGGLGAPAFANSKRAAVPARPQQESRHSAIVNLDLAKLSAEGLLNPNLDRIDMVEELRAIKWPLLGYAKEGEHGGSSRRNLILVTSAMPGEGKTHCAINLAMSIAMEVDHSVLLVDADVVRPSLMSRLGLEPTPGLLDLLTQPELDVSSVLLRTNVPKLILLPAGTPTEKSTELLASTAMDQLLTELADRYSDRIVVFDGPPLHSTSEARVLANHVGQVVLVVEAMRTPQKVVAQALSSLAQCPTVWTLLNKFSPRFTAGPYGRYGSRISEH